MKHYLENIFGSYVPNISGFSDFCSYHTKGYPVFMVDSQLYAGFDMCCAIEYRYNFSDPHTRTEIEQAIKENICMFDVKETDRFFMSNDNMFSRNYPKEHFRRHIKGYILIMKKQYISKDQWPVWYDCQRHLENIGII